MGAERQYVVFRLDGQRYGAPIAVVREVNYMGPITRLPNTPPYVDGVIDLRGEILPVVNLRARLNLAVRAHDTETRLMILSLGDRSSALVVDGVEQVVDLREEDVVAQEPSVSLPGQDYVVGTARADGGLLVILDLDRLMSQTL